MTHLDALSISLKLLPLARVIMCQKSLQLKTVIDFRKSISVCLDVWNVPNI